MFLNETSAHCSSRPEQTRDWAFTNGEQTSLWSNLTHNFSHLILTLSRGGCSPEAVSLLPLQVSDQKLWLEEFSHLWQKNKHSGRESKCPNVPMKDGRTKCPVTQHWAVRSFTRVASFIQHSSSVVASRLKSAASSLKQMLKWSTLFKWAQDWTVLQVLPIGRCCSCRGTGDGARQEVSVCSTSVSLLLST